MNDNDVITAVRDQFATVDLATPVEAVIAHGRVIRHRRRGRAAAGVVATAAVAALVSLPAGHDGPPTRPQLAAWTVTTEPSGTVAVTIHDLRDPADLQRALQAHAVPAIVRFHPLGAPLPSCMIPGTSWLATTYQRVFRQPPGGGHSQALTDINPAAIPATAKIGIDAETGNPGVTMGVELLTRSGRCLPPSRPRGGLTGTAIPGQ